MSRELDFAHRDLATELLIVEGQAEMTSYELAFRQFADRIDIDFVDECAVARNCRLTRLLVLVECGLPSVSSPAAQVKPTVGVAASEELSRRRRGESRRW
ncbi:MAG: hypothetical protein GKR86_09750 [Ilumatobacter sp.]|nr:hypothetical protein [Ilumatobacter sp.]